jgi:hypothetical protein
VPAHTFASIALDGRAAAVGLAIAERGYVGLFDIIVVSGTAREASPAACAPASCSEAASKAPTRPTWP